MAKRDSRTGKAVQRWVASCESTEGNTTLSKYSSSWPVLLSHELRHTGGNSGLRSRALFAAPFAIY